MANSSSSARSSGGLISSGPNVGGCADTIIVVRGNQTKNIKSVSWSYGANGGSPPNSAYGAYNGRLIIVDGLVTPPPGANFPVGIGADNTPGGILSMGGVIKFDQDVQTSAQGGGGEFTFDSSTNDGAIQTTGGALTIILTGCYAGAALATQIIGKLNVQFEDVAPSDNPTRSYSYRPVSQPIQGNG